MQPADPLASLVKGLRDADDTFGAAPLSGDVDQRVLAIPDAPRGNPLLALFRARPVAWSGGLALAGAAAIAFVVVTNDSAGTSPIAHAPSAPAHPASLLLIGDGSNDDARELASGASLTDVDGAARIAFGFGTLDERPWLDTPLGRVEPVGGELELLVDESAMQVIAGEALLQRDADARILRLGERAVFDDEHVKPAAPPATAPTAAAPAAARFDLTAEIRAVEDMVLAGRVDDADARLGALLKQTKDKRALSALSAERVLLRARHGGDVCGALGEHKQIAGELDEELGALAVARNCAP